jgi:hypothetical protein
MSRMATLIAAWAENTSAPPVRMKSCSWPLGKVLIFLPSGRVISARQRPGSVSNGSIRKPLYSSIRVGPKFGPKLSSTGRSSTNKEEYGSPIRQQNKPDRTADVALNALQIRDGRFVRLCRSRAVVIPQLLCGCSQLSQKVRADRCRWFIRARLELN